MGAEWWVSVYLRLARTAALATHSPLAPPFINHLYITFSFLIQPSHTRLLEALAHMASFPLFLRYTWGSASRT